MAGTVQRNRDETYRRLCAAGASLLAREGVTGASVVEADGALVLRFGAGPTPDDAPTLARLAAAAAVAAELAADGASPAPVFLEDAANRIYARPLAGGLLLLVGCAPGWPAGQAYRLADGPAGVMRDAVADLLAAGPPPPPDAPAPDRGPDRGPDPESDPGRAGVFWE